MSATAKTKQADTKGFMPVAILDIETVAHIAMEQAEAMAAMFRSIARLTSDMEIKGLCAHGALQAELQGNDIDCLRERALAAGFDGGIA